MLSQRKMASRKEANNLRKYVKKKTEEKTVKAGVGSNVWEGIWNWKGKPVWKTYEGQTYKSQRRRKMCDQNTLRKTLIEEEEEERGKYLEKYNQAKAISRNLKSEEKEGNLIYIYKYIIIEKKRRKEYL